MSSPLTAICKGSSLGLLFRQIRDAMWARMERELVAAGHELTFSQYITIKELAKGNASVTELARMAQLNPGAMTRLLDKLEQAALVQRIADPADRRALKIHLTEAGLAIWRDINQCGERVHARALSGLSDAERTELARLLLHVRDNLAPTGS